MADVHDTRRGQVAVLVKRLDYAGMTDYDKRTISINHSLVYYPVGEDRTSILHISKPKTNAGIRTIPMLDTVKML